jgi:hypothetical protein
MSKRKNNTIYYVQKIKKEVFKMKKVTAVKVLKVIASWLFMIVAIRQANKAGELVGEQTADLILHIQEMKKNKK